MYQFEKDILEFKRNLLAKNLALLPEGATYWLYNVVFHPDKFPDGIPDNRLNDALGLVERSIIAEGKK